MAIKHTEEMIGFNFGSGPAELPEPEPSSSDKAHKALTELYAWHEHDGRFRARLNAIRDYITLLEPQATPLQGISEADLGDVQGVDVPPGDLQEDLQAPKGFKRSRR